MRLPVAANDYDRQNEQQTRYQVEQEDARNLKRDEDLKLTQGAVVYVRDPATGEYLPLSWASSQAVGRLTDIAALRAKLWTSATRPDVLILRQNYAAGDGGGVFRWDSASTATDDGGITIKETATATGRWVRQYYGEIDARWYGVRADGTTVDTTALQSAVTAAAGRTLLLPPGVILSGTINIASSLRIEGQGIDVTTVRRASGTNGRLFYGSAINDLQFANMTVDGNPSQNTGSGAHDGIRLEGGCSRWLLERVKATGWRGTFSGSPVGAGLSSVSGSDGRVSECVFSDCYDGYSLIGHTNARSYGARITGNQRFGGLVSSASDGFEQYGTVATGNSTTYAAAGVLIVDSFNCKTYGGNFSSNTLGHGLQHNGADYCEVHGAFANANGISGIDFFDSLEGKVYGCNTTGNTIRGIEIDTASNGCVVYGLRGATNADVDVSVFRSSDVTLRDCEGNVRAWDSATLASATIAAAGAGYTNGTFTCTVVGGTRLVAATLSVTVSGGAVTAVSVATAGDYWTLPSNPVTVTGLSAGAGATFNLTWTGSGSATCTRLTIEGGGQADTLTIAAGAASDVRVRALRASTVNDPSGHIIDATASPQALQRSFVAHKNGTNQAGIAATTDTKITFSTTGFNYGGKFDTANSRWTPPAGLVRLSAQVVFSAGTTAPGLYMCMIFKNGSALRKAYDQQPAGAPLGVQVDALDVANGTDYYEVYVWGQSAGTLTVDGNAQITFFQGQVL